jgi:hypothetical protein
MKRTWRTPELHRVGNLAQLVSDTVKVSGATDSASGDPLDTHKHL